MPRATPNLKGNHFGAWTVLERRPPNRQKQACWLCRCDCGTLRVVPSCRLRHGRTMSCGCNRGRNISLRIRTHGCTVNRKPTREWAAWMHANSRCYCKSHKSFKDYGGRGIKVCDRWRESFKSFLADMGPCPDGMSLDRINNDGNYEPGNCRWATRTQQGNNQRTNRLLEFNGRTQTVSEWAREIGIPRSAIFARINAGWTVERALTEPKRAEKIITCDGETKTISEWATLVGITKEGLLYRLSQGWSMVNVLHSPKTQGKPLRLRTPQLTQ